MNPTPPDNAWVPVLTEEVDLSAAPGAHSVAPLTEWLDTSPASAAASASGVATSAAPQPGQQQLHLTQADQQQWLGMETEIALLVLDKLAAQLPDLVRATVREVLAQRDAAAGADQLD